MNTADSKEYYQNLEVDPEYLEFCREFDLKIAAGYEAKASEIRAQVSTYIDLGSAHILDLGCGRGAYGRLLMGNEGRVTGLDLNLTELTLAKSHANPDQNYTLGNGYSLPFSSGSFDLVLCRHTLEHLTRPFEFLSEIHRVLHPGGFGYVSTPNLLSATCFLTTLDGRKFMRRKIWGTDEGVYQIYTLRQLKRLATKAGFIRTECLPLTGFKKPFSISLFNPIRSSHKVLMVRSN